MKTQDWINEQKIEAVQDRKDGKDYWKTDNLYTEADLIELLEAFAIYDVSVSLLERAAALVGNPATNISGSTDLACDEWQKDYERWRNER